MKKEKIIQIANISNNPNPICLTNEGRILACLFMGGDLTNWKWQDITPKVSEIK